MLRSNKCKRDQIEKILNASQKIAKQVKYLQGNDTTKSGNKARISDTFGKDDLAELIACQKSFQTTLVKVSDLYKAEQDELNDALLVKLEKQENPREKRFAKLRSKGEVA